MDKEILVQYRIMKEEIRDLRRRIRELEKFIENPHLVSDTVTRGKRGKKPLGTVTITGIPDRECRRKAALKERYKKLLELKEVELLELTCQVEEYIDSIPKSELRIMFRLYYIDGLPWWKVAQAMNSMFPKRRVKFTEDSCRIRNNRFFEEN